MKITLITLSSLIIAFSILCITLFFIQYKTVDSHLITTDPDTYSMEKKFYSGHFDPNEKKIFILGSSHVMPLNTTIIQKLLQNDNQNYSVYNLAIGSDLPIERIDTLDMIINVKPSIVVYGIADRDFVSFNLASVSQVSKTSTILPDPHEFFTEIFSRIMNPFQHSLEFLQSPKIIILRYIQDIFLNHQAFEEKLDGVHYPNSPFFSTKKSDMITSSKEDLMNLASSINQVQFNQVASQFREITPPDKNENFIALEDIITKLHNNNIKVIVFITPQNKLYLDSMPKQYKKSFDIIINKLSNESNIEFYSLFDKYENLNVWHDLNHVSRNSNNTIYCNDIVKMIEGEIHP